MRSLQTILNEANPNLIPAAAQVAKLGTLLTGAPQFRRRTVASHIATLPDEAKAAALISVISTVGTLTGALAVVLSGAPTTGQVSISPTGNVIFAVADAVTQAEILYVAQTGPVIEETIDVVSNVGTLLQSRAARTLLSAVATAGTSPGAKTVDFRGAVAAAGEALINAAGTGIVFNGTDAITRATVRYIATPGVGTTPADNVAGLKVVDNSF